MERRLSLREAGSAAQIQQIIDAVARKGGRVVLPEMELTLDRGLALRSGVELVGQGEKTVLRKGPGRVYPLSGYHNYGMCDVPLLSSAGLQVGMTVSIHDDHTHGSFYETFATITWIADHWVGLDHGLEADYRAESHPCLTTVYPLIFGHGIREAAVRDLCLEGNQAESEKGMGGCRGAAVYFANSRDLEISGIRERDYFGEGLGLQMCRDVRVIDCRFNANRGNGLHPGAGSTNILFSRCAGEENERSGFFFCVRANHIDVREGEFKRNGVGMSIGTRDCHNRIEDCCLEGNQGAGLLVRETPRPTEVHSCLIRGCRISGNAHRGGQGQVELTGDAHDLIVADCQIEGISGKPGIFIAPSAQNIYLEGNRFAGETPQVEAAPESLAQVRPQFACGYGEWPEAIFRHLWTA